MATTQNDRREDNLSHIITKNKNLLYFKLCIYIYIYIYIFIYYFLYYAFTVQIVNYNNLHHLNK